MTPWYKISLVAVGTLLDRPTIVQVVICSFVAVLVFALCGIADELTRLRKAEESRDLDLH